MQSTNTVQYQLTKPALLAGRRFTRKIQFKTLFSDPTEFRDMGAGSMMGVSPIRTITKLVLSYQMMRIELVCVTVSTSLELTLPVLE